MLESRVRSRTTVQCLPRVLGSPLLRLTVLNSVWGAAEEVFCGSPHDSASDQTPASPPSRSNPPYRTLPLANSRAWNCAARGSLPAIGNPWAYLSLFRGRALGRHMGIAVAGIVF